MKSKLKLRKVQEHDKKHGTCFIRELEMAVDAVADYNIGITLQFWSDALIYGFDEAILYLQGYLSKRDLSEVKACVERARKAVLDS